MFDKVVDGNLKQKGLGVKNMARWNQASILLAIRRYAESRAVTVNGAKVPVPPTAREWRVATEKHPSNQTVREHFKTWDDAIRQAGFEPRGRGRPKGTRARRVSRGREVRAAKEAAA